MTYWGILDKLANKSTSSGESDGEYSRHGQPSLAGSTAFAQTIRKCN